VVVRNQCLSDILVATHGLFPSGSHKDAGADPGGQSPQSPPLEATKVSFFTLILNNSENSIGDIRPFCHPLFCHSSVVRYTLSLLQSGPALARAGPNARPGRGAPLSSDFMTSSCSVNRVTIVVERRYLVKH